MGEDSFVRGREEMPKRLGYGEMKAGRECISEKLFSYPSEMGYSRSEGCMKRLEGICQC